MHLDGFAARRLRFALAVLLLAGVRSPAVADDLRGVARAATRVGQQRAEEIFAGAEAAVWFPALGEARWLEPREAIAVPRAEPTEIVSLREFEDGIERDFPRFRESAHGPFLLKRPASTMLQESPVEAAEGPLEPLATVFTDSFETGLGNWTLTNNSQGSFSWGATTCEARTGSHSADAVRGGASAPDCTAPYASNVVTTMTNSSCEATAGAAKAWLDAYIHVATETSHDTIGFFYKDAGGTGRGYAFSGTWNAWFRVVFNLKQWYRVGDVTATSCPRLAIQFSSDEDIEAGFGARVDDVTIRTGAVSFASASIAASPASGAVPLTVSFVPTVTGLSANATYLWSFGEGTTATTPNASFTYTEPGTYHARLRVADGATNVYAHRTITATAGSACAVACTATVPRTAAPGTAALFQATATATGCSGTPSYSWAFGDGKTSSQNNASHAYSSPGRYDWTLTASVGGTSCKKTGTITVGASARKRLVTKPADASLASGVIGSAGGTLSGGGLTLTVPAGAFASNTTIAIRKAGVPRAEGDLTDTYAIAGLPAKLGGSITLELEVGSASLGANEKFYVSAGASMYVKSMPAAQANVTRMIPVEATKSGTRVKVTLPSTWRMPAGDGSPSAAAANAIEAQDSGRGDLATKAARLIRYQTAHFIALAEPSEAAQANAILAMLEGHYTSLTSYGFSLACRNDSSGQFRKIMVELNALGTGADDALGYHVSGGDPCGTNWFFTSDFLEITTSVPASDARGVAGHELFHLVQDMYSPGGAAANLWLKEASSTWFESTMGLCPDVQSANSIFPWKGLFNASGSATGTPTNHGYGASYALKYKTDASAVTYSPFVYTLWENIRSGSSEAAAFQSALGSSLPAYWKAFAKDFFSGTHTGSCFPTWANFDRLAVADEKALPKSTTIDAYPLSAKSWNIDLLKFKSAAVTPVTIEAAGLNPDQSVFVYDVKAKSEIAELTKTNPTFAIDDLNTFAGTLLVLVFVDMNLPGTSPASTNKVTLNFGTAQYRCFAFYYVKSFVERRDSGDSERGGGLYDGGINDKFLGAIQGETFHAEKMWCPEPPLACRWDPRHDVNVSFDFDFVNKGAQIRNVRVRASLLTDEMVVPWLLAIDVTAPMPRVRSDATGFQYKISGDICSSVTYSETAGGGYRITDIVCDANSYFFVTCDAIK